MIIVSAFLVAQAPWPPEDQNVSDWGFIKFLDKFQELYQVPEDWNGVKLNGLKYISFIWKKIHTNTLWNNLTEKQTSGCIQGIIHL